MIRKAFKKDFETDATNECAVRIHSLHRAYGTDVPFLNFYADDQGGLMSVMDGTAVLASSANIEEWLLFITMNPDIYRVHCSAEIGSSLIKSGGWKGREGTVLSYRGATHLQQTQVCENPYLPNVYTLLSSCFNDMPPLNAWYPDASHRLRHNCGKIAVILDDETVVSTAMTVAETEYAALIGQVATHTDYRGRGYAQSCINSLISRCKDKQLYILPMTEYAQSIYTKMGFIPVGDWAELQRI